MKQLITNYTFNKATRRIVFTDYISIDIEGLLMITNISNANKPVLYQFNNPDLTVTATGNTITLSYDTSSMNNSDLLQIFYDDIIDGKIIHSDTHSLITDGLADIMDTTGYGHIAIQLSGIWSGNITFQVSNDKINWEDRLARSSDDISIQDIIDNNGIYTIKCSAKYLKYSILRIVGSISIVAVGRIGIGPSAVDRLSIALDKTQLTPLQVQLPRDMRQDSDGSLIVSDMPTPIYWNSPSAVAPMIIDCKGYTTVTIQKITTGVITPTISNDGVNYVATLATPVSSGTIAATTILTAAGIYVIPIVARYLKLTGPASIVQCYIYLSQAPYNAYDYMVAPPVNISQLAGTPPVTANVAGTLAVGGNVASGAAPTTFPLQMGGVDDVKGATAALTALMRRILVDSLGRQQIGTHTGNAPGTTSNKALNEIGFLSDYKNVLEVRDSMKDENGLSQVELMNQILIEMKIMNQQLYELPRILKDGSTSNDEPDEFRNDPTIFKNY